MVCRAKEEAFAKMNSSHKSSYQLLPEYYKGIEENNLGNLVRFEIIFEPKFISIFICYSASAQGFTHCQPLLGLGTHLKAKYQGIFLAATAVDTTRSLFPLSHAVVDAENDKNWS